MTGFARHDGGDDAVAWTWEIKSVNGRNLDVRCRVPAGSETLEAAARTAAAKRCARGNLQIGLTVTRREESSRLQVNAVLLDRLIELCGKVASDAVAPPRLDGLLAVRGVIELVEEDDSPEEASAREAALLAGLERALDDLVRVREAEGARLAEMVADHLTAIDGLVDQAGRSAAAQPEALRARLKVQLEELLEAAPALPEERLAQEAAVLINKSDPREELDRLGAHVGAARDLLSEGGAIGRRLDFLCQEFNREANTLCAKSSGVELTRTGLELKSRIDQLREQVQNIE
jgi:uncharacterized protein (TIGR00255 family)